MNNLSDSVEDKDEVLESETSKVVTSDKNSVIIKCGEVQLIKNNWNLQLVCAECGKELAEIQEFLLHSLQHHFSVTENEINLLISQVNGKKTSKETELDDEIKQECEVETNFAERELSGEENEIDFSSEPLGTDETSPIPKENLSVLQHENLSASNEYKNSHKNFEFLDTAEKIIESKVEADESGYSFKNQQQNHSTSSSNVQTSENIFDNFICKYCTEAFENITNYAKHIEQHIGFDLYECPKCDKGYVLIAQLKRHVRTHAKNLNTKPKRNQNKKNSNAVETEDQLTEDPKRNQSKKNSNGNANENDEKLIEDPSEICSTILTEPTIEPKFEYTEVHVPKKKRAARVLRGKTLNETESTVEQQVEKIQQTVSEDIPKEPKKKKPTKTEPKKKGEHKCTECQKVFAKRFSLTVHYRTHNKEPFVTCEICGATFSDSTNLHTHRKRHMGIKKHKCTLCDKSFVATTELKIHMRSHTGERPYSCEECGRNFKTSSSYCDHRRRHTNDRPYVCETCGKRFYDKKTLRKHQRCHTGETPYACTECSMSFGQPNSLKEHLKLHSGIKGHICKICGEAFTQNAGLYSHMKRHKKAAEIEASKTETFAG